MMRLERRASLLVAFYLLTSAATASAECAWVLWGYPDGTVFEPPQPNSPPRPLQRTTRVRAPSAPFIIGAYQTRTECMAQPDIGAALCVLVPGASWRKGIGAAMALALARDGWDVAATFWLPYDERMPWGSDPADVPWLRDQLEAHGGLTKDVAPSETARQGRRAARGIVAEPRGAPREQPHRLADAPPPPIDVARRQRHIVIGPRPPRRGPAVGCNG